MVCNSRMTVTDGKITRMHLYEEAAGAFSNYVNLLPNKDHSEKADWSRSGDVVWRRRRSLAAGLPQWSRRPSGRDAASGGIGEGLELGFPLGLEGAGDEPVLGVDVAEGAVGAVGFVAGAFDG